MSDEEIKAREAELDALKTIVKKLELKLQTAYNERKKTNSNIGVCRSFIGERLQCTEE